MENKPKLTTIDVAARIVGIPQKWLRSEVAAGRLPSLRIGRRVYCDPETITASLRERAGTRHQQFCMAALEVLIGVAQEQVAKLDGDKRKAVETKLGELRHKLVDAAINGKPCGLGCCFGCGELGKRWGLV